MYNLQQSINYAQPFIEYSPLSAGTAFEPALSMATVIRNTILNAPFTWGWNRNEATQAITSANQDYTIALTDFGFLEKVTLVDGSGNSWEIKDVYNTNILGIANSNQKARPVSVAVKSVNYGTNVILRFMTFPDVNYTAYITYQVLALPFSSFTVTAAANAVAGNTSYTGTFNAASFVAGAQALISGFTTAANNGTFTIVSCNATTLVVANPSGASETHAATAINISWNPLPDSFMDIFNTLFLGEAFQAVDDARGAQYRQRGIAALLAKSEGLSEVDKSMYLEQFLIRDSQSMAKQQKTQQGGAARGI